MSIHYQVSYARKDMPGIIFAQVMDGERMCEEWIESSKEWWAERYDYQISTLVRFDPPKQVILGAAVWRKTGDLVWSQECIVDVPVTPKSEMDENTAFRGMLIGMAIGSVMWACFLLGLYVAAKGRG